VNERVPGAGNGKITAAHRRRDAAILLGSGMEVLLRAGACVWPTYVTQGTDGGLAAHGELLSSEILLVRPGWGG
jgi:hypothetical protein